MKGVSTVIATILMLMITIALAGMAYMYISGIFSPMTQGIEIADAYCLENGQTAATAECAAPPCDQAVFVIRNIGTNPITLPDGITITQTSPAADTDTSDGDWGGVTSLDPGATAVWKNTCGGTGGRSCIYRFVPAMGKTVTGTVYCT